MSVARQPANLHRQRRGAVALSPSSAWRKRSLRGAEVEWLAGEGADHQRGLDLALARSVPGNEAAGPATSRASIAASVENQLVLPPGLKPDGDRGIWQSGALQDEPEALCATQSP